MITPDTLHFSHSSCVYQCCVCQALCSRYHTLRERSRGWKSLELSVGMSVRFSHLLAMGCEESLYSLVLVSSIVKWKDELQACVLLGAVSQIKWDNWCEAAVNHCKVLCRGAVHCARTMGGPQMFVEYTSGSYFFMLQGVQRWYAFGIL